MPQYSANALTGMQPGFEDAVHDAQRCFRVALDAMGHAGRIGALPVACNIPLLNAAQAALLLALTDQDAPVWLHPRLRSGEVEAWLRFHTGAPLCAHSSEALFVVLPDLASLPPLSALQVGSHEYPDRSATLLVAVPELAQDGPLQLSGPGIRGSRSLYVGGWNDGVSAWRAENQQRFPCGVDLVLCCDERIATLPRTTIVAQGVSAVSTGR